VTLRVPLAQPVHVLILYGTAVASEDGVVHFFDDIYGQDRRLQALLGLRPVGSELRPEAAEARKRWPLPATHATSIHVDEVGGRIKTHSAATE